MSSRITGEQTVVFVSHMADQVKAMCDRVIWLDQGKIVAEGDATEVTDAYTNDVAKAYLAAIEQRMLENYLKEQEAKNAEVQDQVTPSRHSD